MLDFGNAVKMMFSGRNCTKEIRNIIFMGVFPKYDGISSFKDVFKNWRLSRFSLAMKIVDSPPDTSIIRKTVNKFKKTVYYHQDISLFVRFVLSGCEFSGKSSFLRHLMREVNHFDDMQNDPEVFREKLYSESTGINIQSIFLQDMLSSVFYKIQIINFSVTSDHQRFRIMMDSFIRGVNMIGLFFNVCSKTSFIYACQRYKEINEFNKGVAVFSLIGTFEL